MTNKKLGRAAKDGTFTYSTLLVAGMHFLDVYNYDIERVKRCVIHYTDARRHGLSLLHLQLRPVLSGEDRAAVFGAVGKGSSFSLQPSD